MPIAMGPGHLTSATKLRQTGWVISLLSVLLLAAPIKAKSELTEHQQFTFEVFRQLMSMDTTNTTGNTQAAVEYLAELLIDEGLPAEDVQIVTYGASTDGHPKGNLVVRLRADKPIASPVLFIAHIDVVEADPADWSPEIDPMKLTEKDSYFYGRGSIDNKDEVAIHIANLVFLHRQQVSLTRDIIVAITSDEEGGPHNGALHLVTEHPALIDAAFAFNEGGSGVMRGGRAIANTVQTAEKIYQTYTLEVSNPGGHSSLPRSDNAIYDLSRALLAIEAHEFPVMLNDTTRAYFRGQADLSDPERGQMLNALLEEPPSAEAIAYFAQTPSVNARLRTTCVATQLDAGHAENALPQRASATVNCRVFPGVPVKEVQQTLMRLIDNEAVSITPVMEAMASDASPLTDEVMNPISQITAEMWPGAAVIPVMSTGATDSLFFRNAGIPVYGVSGIFVEEGDYRAHGRDERISETSFFEGLEFLYRLTRAVAVSEDEPTRPTSLQQDAP